MKFNTLRPVLALAIISCFFACKKDISPISQAKFGGKIDTLKPSDSTTTDGNTKGNAPDSIKTMDSINNVVENTPLQHTAVVMAINGNTEGFWQSLPSRYQITTKKYPLIIFIHGIGELGTNLARINCCGLPKHLSNKSFPSDFEVNGKHYSFIVMSPQFKKRPTADDVQSVVDFAKRRFRVDAAKIYVAGLSMGGGCTWDYAAVYGQNVAAVVPVCGGTQPSGKLAKNIASKYLPVWTLHSADDTVVPVLWAKNWVNWIRQDNPSMTANTKLTIWTSLSHNSTWAKAFDPATKVDGMNIYQWMLQYQRN